MIDAPGIWHIFLALRLAGGEMFYVNQTTNYVGQQDCADRVRELTQLHWDDERFKTISCKRGMVVVVTRGSAQ